MNKYKEGNNSPSSVNTKIKNLLSIIMTKPGIDVTFKTTRILGKTQVCEYVPRKSKLHLLWPLTRCGIKNIQRITPGNIETYNWIYPLFCSLKKQHFNANCGQYLFNLVRSGVVRGSIEIVVLCLQAGRLCWRGFNPDLVLSLCIDGSLYPPTIKLNVASRDIACTEWNRQ